MGQPRVARRRIASLALFTAALVASIGFGTPSADEFPDVALGWVLLLHVERAAALLALVGMGALLVERTIRGRMPSRIGSIDYSAERVIGVDVDLEERVAVIEESLRKLKAMVERLEHQN